MSNQLHDGESERRKQVKFRAPESQIEQFDKFVSQSDQYSSRSEAIRAAMGRLAGESDAFDTPLEPPADDTLRQCYAELVEICNPDGIIPHDLATSELSRQTGKSVAVVESAYIGKLWDRGYIRSITNFDTSSRSWKLAGWDK